MDVFATNRAAWDAMTPHHVGSAFYDVEGFVAGACPLTDIDKERVGDVRGRSLLHLQCHFGMDTLAWARRGARVTGLDFSAAAIEEARRLAARVDFGADARFVQTNVLDAPRAVGSLAGGSGFDIVFTSWGVLGWLPDLGPWARAAADCLAPNGVLHVCEFHPFCWIWDDAFEAIVYAYEGRGTEIVEERDGSYANRQAPIRTRTIGFNHGLATIVTALLDAGLSITSLTEYDYSPYEVFPGMSAEHVDGHDRWRIDKFAGRPPLAFGLTATKRI